MKKIENITFGADPVCFIINEETDKVVSSIGIIPGLKGEPWRGEDMPKGYGIEIDNILAEFNIPPAKTRDAFVGSIEYMKEYLTAFVKRINPKYGIKCSASELVDEDQLQSDEAKLFGCSPDFNIYTGCENPKPHGETTNLRSAGFHVHCGYKNQNVQTSLELIQYFELYLGILATVKDRDQRRRSLYGKAGCFRLTGYGFEYRVLSAAMYATPELTGQVYDQCMKAIHAYEQDEIDFDDEFKNTIRTTIDTGDFDKAQELAKQFNLF